MTFPDTLFVTGTDTDVGKTVLCAALCAGLDSCYWKPVQAGTEPMTDSERVRLWSGLPATRIFQERYILREPMSPHAAADLEDVEISLDDFETPDTAGRPLIVEGAGGLIVPINWRETVLDLMVRFRMPVLLVARSGLGTLNHTLLSIRALRDAGLEIWGVVLNGPSHPSNEETIRHFGRIERLFSFPPLETVEAETLKQQFHKSFFGHAS